MPTSSAVPLATMLRASLHELRTAAGEYTPLIRQLEAILRDAERGEINALALKEAHTASLSHPRLQPTRAAAATEDGLESTRALLVEIKNRVVTFEREAGRAKDEKGADSKAC